LDGDGHGGVANEEPSESYCVRPKVASDDHGEVGTSPLNQSVLEMLKTDVLFDPFMVRDPLICRWMW